MEPDSTHLRELAFREEHWSKTGLKGSEEGFVEMLYVVLINRVSVYHTGLHKVHSLVCSQ